MTTDNNNLQELMDEFERYVKEAIKVKAERGDNHSYHILVRENNALQLAAWVDEKGKLNGYAHYHVAFQSVVQRAALDPTTVIHTVGEQVRMRYDFNNRTYVPSHVDVYESNRVIHDLTGIRL